MRMSETDVQRIMKIIDTFHPKYKIEIRPIAYFNFNVNWGGVSPGFVGTLKIKWI